MKTICKEVYMNSRNSEFILMFHKAINNDLKVCISIAQYFRTPSSILDVLAKRVCEKGKDVFASVVRIELLNNPNITIETIEFLVDNSPGKETKQTVGRRNYTPTYLLEKLSKDADEITRAGVARNPNTPFNILEELIEDPNENVRIAVVENPNVPDYLLEKLGKDPRPLVKYALAQKPGTPQYIKYRKENNLPL